MAWGRPGAVDTAIPPKSHGPLPEPLENPPDGRSWSAGIRGSLRRAATQRKAIVAGGGCASERGAKGPGWLPPRQPLPTATNTFLVDLLGEDADYPDTAKVERKDIRLTNGGQNYRIPLRAATCRESKPPSAGPWPTRVVLS